MRKPLNDKQWKCPHSGEERRGGTWCTPEIVKAVEMGYTLVRIHEVWHFPKRQAGFSPTMSIPGSRLNKSQQATQVGSRHQNNNANTSVTTKPEKRSI